MLRLPKRRLSNTARVPSPRMKCVCVFPLNESWLRRIIQDNLVKLDGLLRMKVPLFDDSTLVARCTKAIIRLLKFYDGARVHVCVIEFSCLG